MRVLTKTLSAALLASVVSLAQPSVSLACDGDAQAKEDKKSDKTVAQREPRQEKTRQKRAEQAQTDKQAQASDSNKPSTN